MYNFIIQVWFSYLVVIFQIVWIEDVFLVLDAV